MVYHSHNTRHLTELDKLRDDLLALKIVEEKHREQRDKLQRENELLRNDNRNLLLRARGLLTFNRLLLDRLNGKAA